MSGTRCAGGSARVDDETFTRLWLDLRISTAEIARVCGVWQCSVSRRAKRLGLPSRAARRRRRFDYELACEMWRAGVCAQKIADFFGVDMSAISRAASGMGLPPRPRGFRGITLGEFREILLARAMAAEAEAARRRIRE